MLVNENNKRTDMTKLKWEGGWVLTHLVKQLGFPPLSVSTIDFALHLLKYDKLLIYLGTIYQLALSPARGSILWVSKTLETICAALVQSCWENGCVCTLKITMKNQSEG